MSKAWLFFKNDRYKQQQTDRIVNNCWREFVTEPRTYYILKKGQNKENGCAFR